MNHKDSKISHQLRIRIKKLLNQLNHLTRIKNTSFTNIHELRVNIKRWKVFFDFIDWLGGHSKKLEHQKQELNILFGAAGKLRKAQIIVQKIKNKDINTKQIKKLINKLNKIILRNANNFSFNSFQNTIKKYLQHLNCFDEATLKNLISDYKSDLIKRISLYKNFKNVKMIHSLRILARKIIDVQQFFPDTHSKGAQRSYNKIRKQLGLWHDELDFITYLKEKIKNGPKGAEKKLYKKYLIEAEKNLKSFLEVAKKQFLELEK